MMSLAALPSPVVLRVLSFLDAADALSYLQVVAPLALASFPLARFELARRFHGGRAAAEALLRLARRSRRVALLAAVPALQPFAVVRGVARLAAVRHLDLRGVALSPDLLARLFPVLARLESLRYRVRAGRGEVGVPAPGAGEGEPYRALRALHVEAEGAELGALAPLLPPGLRRPPALTELALESGEAADAALPRRLGALVDAGRLRALALLTPSADLALLVGACLREASGLRALTLSAGGRGLSDLRRALALGLETAPGPADGRRLALTLRPSRAAAPRGPGPAEPLKRLLAAGAALRVQLEAAGGRWAARGEEAEPDLLELGPDAAPLLAAISPAALAAVRVLSAPLDEGPGPALAVLGPCRPSALRLLLRRPAPAHERAAALSAVAAWASALGGVEELTVYGVNFMALDELDAVLDILPRLSALHLFHCKFYAWRHNVGITRLFRSLARRPRLQQLTLAVPQACWDAQLVAPDRLLPALAQLPHFRRLLLYCPSLRAVQDKEASFHNLIRARPSLEEVTLVVPGLSTPTAHLVVKRLRATVHAADDAHAKKMIFRVLSSLSGVRDAEPLASFLERDFE